MKLNLRRTLALFLGMVVGAGIGILAVNLLRADDSPRISTLSTEAGSRQTLEIDAPAPDFELISLSGEGTALEDFRGKVVLLNFWATWCGPCRLEMPAFQARFDSLGDDLSVVAVNFDEAESDVQAFVDELGLTFDVLLDPGAEVQRLYQVRGYPTSYLIDQDGVVRIIHIGIMTEGQLDDYLIDMGISEEN